MTRLTITAVSFALGFGAQHVRIPGAEDPFAPTLPILGFAPILQAFLLVEVVAWAWPGLRSRRMGGLADRLSLRRVAEVLSLLLAGAQAWLLAGSGLYSALGSVFLDPTGFQGRMLITVFLAVSTAVVLALARLVDTRGMGGGLAVMFVATTAGSHQLVYGTVTWVGEVGRVGIWSAYQAVVTPAVMGLLVCGTWTAISARLSGDAVPERRLDVPACGVVPLLLVPTLLMLPPLGSTPRPAVLFALPHPWAERAALALPRSLVTSAPMQCALAAGLGVVLTWMLHRYRTRTSTTFPREAAQSAAVAVGLVLVQTYLATLGMFVSVAYVTIVVAMLWDLWEEWKFRRVHEDATFVEEIHDPHVIARVEQQLETRGIPSLCRARALRTLLHAFGPHVGPQLYVPESHAEAAEEVVDRELDAVAP